MRYSRRLLARSRAWHRVAGGLAAVAGVVVLLSGPVPAWGVTQPGDSPCLQSTGSLTLSSSTIYAGQSVSASWTTHRPAGCEGVVSELDGPGASVSGGVGGTATLTPPNMGVNTYTVTVFYPAGHVAVASASVTVQPPPASITDPARMCVGVRGGNSANGTPVELETCNYGTAGQQWTAPGDGTIHALGKCLDVAGGDTVRGTAVQLSGCNGSGSQIWATSNTALVNPASRLCLDATGASTAAGTPLQIWDCTSGDAAQQWTLPQGSALPVDDANSGTVTLTPQGQAVGPGIHCSISVSNPALTRLDGAFAVTADGSTYCDSAVLHLEMHHALIRNGLGADEDDEDSSSGHSDRQLATAVLATCAQGQWSSFAYAIIQEPYYDPPLSVIYSTNDTKLNVSVSQCLPNVTGMSDSDARTYIQQQLHLTLGTVTTQASDSPVGSVISESLEADGQTVDLVESRGNDTPPNVLGDEESDAITRIQEAGLVVGTDTHVDDCKSPGDVEMQDPIGGAGVMRGTSVNIWVSVCSGIPK